ncbi:CBS domain-containing protein [Kutzneria sp. CA-103260]|uniref:CBS domain-containing protein n=1 Tax=Kutzneria sp. CA-103260 TaxID=2802641 RepID=UPI001BA84CB7|nr:CBS domain-containing protein [Kutzneria sp. CA-103260]QUQ64067.1 CBS domain-containing protein [Kutzneria sp. CA-103260]
MRHREISAVMTTDVAVVRGDTPFKDVVALLAERRVSGVPVLDKDDRVVGIVSETDLLHGTTEKRKPFWAGGRHGYHPHRVAAQLMTSPAVCVHPDATVAHAAKLLAEEGVRRLPVVDAEGRLVGVVSRRDMLGVFLRSDRDLREEILTEVFGRALWMDPNEVSVEVQSGVANLRGQVETEALVDIAGTLTRGVDGVVDVHNQLTFARDDREIDRAHGKFVDFDHEPLKPVPRHGGTS